MVKDYAVDPPPISASAGKLQQVFTNLILNARDAMVGGGTITLKTYADSDDAVVVEISDTGEGIPAENLNKVFDPFFTTASGTAGLGLAVTYGIIQEHAGSIEVQSREGEGTTFKMTFPTAQKQGRQLAVS